MSPPSDEVIEGALTILEQGRIGLVAGYADRAAVVCGRSGWYTVRAYSDRLTCDCDAAGAAWCSHRLAAMLAWGEGHDTPFGVNYPRTVVRDG